MPQRKGLMPTRTHRVVIPLAALAAVLPLLWHGPSCGHDFDFHVLSWLEAASQLAHFSYPRWAYTPAWNAGEPRFLFYPPLSWMLGALLGLGLPWHLVPAAFTWIALTLSGFSMHRLVRRYAGGPAALVAAVLYLANPYMLFTAYERTAYGELLAAAWMPLLFQAALAARIDVAELALPVALLWLTNAPAGVMGCYALAFVTLARLLLPRADRHGGSVPAMGRLETGLRVFAAAVLGLALSCFYLIPAAIERRFVQTGMAVISGMRIADNTLFHHMPPSPDNAAHDVVLHTASVIAVGLLASIAAAVALARGARPEGRSESKVRALLPLVLLAGLIAFLLTPASLPVWAYTPELKFLQFPWRLMSLLAAILAVFASLSFERLKLAGWRSAALAAGLAAALIALAWPDFHQSCDVEDTVEARVALFHSNRGTDPTDEYTPVTADNDSIRHPPQQTDPPYWLVPASPDPAGDAINTPAPANVEPGPAPSSLTLTLTTPEFLILNLRQFPDWQITLNGKPVTPCPEVRDDGLLTLALPAGSDTVHIAFRRTPDQTAGMAISGVAALIALGLWRRRAASPAFG
jgi:hypothetical protein